MRNPDLFSCIEYLGGPDGLYRLMQRFYQKQESDIMIGFFFEGRDIERIAQKQTHFFMSACGLMDYQGILPQNAHKGLAAILPGQFNRRLQILKDILTEAGLPENLRSAWVRFEASFEHVIVAKSN